MKQADVARIRSSVLLTPGDQKTEDHDSRDGEERERPTGHAALAVAGEPGRQVAVGGERGHQLRGPAEVDVHRPHRQGDCEDGGRVTPGAAEADGDQVGERHLRVGAAGDADRRDGEADVDDGDDAEGERHRAWQVDLGPAEVAGELRDGLPADEQPDEDVRGGADGPPAVRRERRPVVAGRDGSATEIAVAITTTSTDESASWKPDEMRSPKRFATSTVANIASPTIVATVFPEPVRSAT